MQRMTRLTGGVLLAISTSAAWAVECWEWYDLTESNFRAEVPGGFHPRSHDGRVAPGSVFCIDGSSAYSILNGRIRSDYEQVAPNTYLWSNHARSDESTLETTQIVVLDRARNRVYPSATTLATGQLEELTGTSAGTAGLRSVDPPR